MTMATLPQPVRPAIARPAAIDLAEAEYRNLHDLLASLDDDDWGRPTDCTGWTVRDMAGHVLGGMRGAASIVEGLRQQREWKRRSKANGTNEVDEMTALQIEVVAGLSTAELVADIRRLVGPAAAGRRKTPAPLRRWMKVPVEVPGVAEVWTLGYLTDVIFTRDTWMHRVDISRATGREVRLTAEHDGVLVADIAREWLARHGQPVTLILGGPAGGTFTQGTGGPVVEIDAVEFCRVMSGRSTPTHPLLETLVPF